MNIWDYLISARNRKALDYSEDHRITQMYLRWRSISAKRNAGILGNVHMRIHTTAMEIVTNRNRNLPLLFLAITAFGFGSFIYLCFIPANLFLYDWFCIDVQADWIQALRNGIGKLDTPDWFRYNLPDALWFFSYLLIMEIIWNKNEKLYKALFIYVMLAVAIAAELFQYLHIIPGSGDWWDVAAYILTLLTFYLFKSL